MGDLLTADMVSVSQERILGGNTEVDFSQIPR